PIRTSCSTCRRSAGCPPRCDCSASTSRGCPIPPGTGEARVPREADASVLAFDFGTRRIGVAVGNTLTRVAHPLATIEAADAARWTALRALVDEWRPQRLVVGLPVHADGTEHAMTVRTRDFARELQQRF